MSYCTCDDFFNCDRCKALYDLSKRLRVGEMECIKTSYGDIELNEEMEQAIVKALTPFLEAIATGKKER